MKKAVISMLFSAFIVSAAVAANNHTDKENIRVENVYDAHGKKIGHREVNTTDHNVVYEYDADGNRTGYQRMDNNIPNRMNVYDYKDNLVGWTEKDPKDPNIIHKRNTSGENVGYYKRDAGSDTWKYHDYDGSY